MNSVSTSKILSSNIRILNPKHRNDIETLVVTKKYKKWPNKYDWINMNEMMKSQVQNLFQPSHDPWHGWNAHFQKSKHLWTSWLFSRSTKKRNARGECDAIWNNVFSSSKVGIINATQNVYTYSTFTTNFTQKKRPAGLATEYFRSDHTLRFPKFWNGLQEFIPDWWRGK